MADKFWVIHDYGTEGWKIQAECESIYAAVMAREKDLSNGGGRSEIVQVIPALEAYRRADYEKDRIDRELAGK